MSNAKTPTSGEPSYCPTFETAPNGFALSSSRRVVEVRYLANYLVRRITYYPSLHRDEHLLFQGLIRLNSSSGLAWEPHSNLSELFPLELGKAYHFCCDEHLPGRESIKVETTLDVVKREKYVASGCRYEVLHIKYAASNELPNYIRYAPSLRFTLTEQVGRATGFGYRFHPLEELPLLLEKLSNQAR